MRNLKKSLVLSVLISMLALDTAAYASGLSSQVVLASKVGQKQIPVSEEFLKEAEKAIAERDSLRVQLALRDDLLKLRDQTIETLKSGLAAESVRADNWMKAALERKEAITISDEMVKLYEKQINNYALSEARLQSRVERAESRTKYIAVIAYILGVGTYAAVSK
jgi:hypothetical protein